MSEESAYCLLVAQLIRNTNMKSRRVEGLVFFLYYTKTNVEIHTYYVYSSRCM